MQSPPGGTAVIEHSKSGENTLFLCIIVFIITTSSCELRVAHLEQVALVKGGNDFSPLLYLCSSSFVSKGQNFTCFLSFRTCMPFKTNGAVNVDQSLYTDSDSRWLTPLSLPSLGHNATLPSQGQDTFSTTPRSGIFK